MAPKKGKKVSDVKAVQDVLATLDGKEISAETVLALTTNQRKGLSAALNTFRNKFPQHEISQCFGEASNDLARRQAMSRYLIAAGDGSLDVVSEQSITSEKKGKAVQGWMHIPEIATYVGSTELAELISKSCEPRESEYEHCRAAGMQQYWYVHKTQEASLSVKDKTKLSNKQQLSEEAYQGVRADMMNVMDGIRVADMPTAEPPPPVTKRQKLAIGDKPASSGSGEPPVVEATPQKKAMQEFLSAQSAAEALYTRIQKELKRGDLAVDRISKIPVWGNSVADAIKNGKKIEEDSLEEFYKTTITEGCLTFGDRTGSCSEDTHKKYSEQAVAVKTQTEGHQKTYKKRYIVDVLGDFAKYTK